MGGMRITGVRGNMNTTTESVPVGSNHKLITIEVGFTWIGRDWPRQEIRPPSPGYAGTSRRDKSARADSISRVLPNASLRPEASAVAGPMADKSTFAGLRRDRPARPAATELLKCQKTTARQKMPDADLRAKMAQKRS